MSQPIIIKIIDKTTTRKTPTTTEIRNNFKLPPKFPQPYTHLSSILNKIIIDLEFALRKGKKNMLIRAKLFGFHNSIRQIKSKVKILPLEQYNLNDTNIPQYILTNKNIPNQFQQSHGLHRRTDIYPVPNTTRPI